MKACIKPISMLMLSFVLSVFATGFVFQANTAQAAINAVSAGRNFANFPQWYEDLAAGGVRVQLCLGTNPDGTGLADPNCVLPTLPPLEPNYDPTQAISFPGNFPSEAFYWIADSEIPAIGTGGDRARLRVALEGAFASGTPQAGQQITFLRVNLTGITGLAPNSTYNVTYPYGTFQITTDGTGNTIDTGNAAFRAEDPITPVAISILPTAYELLLPATDTHVSSLLRWTTGAPAGYLGDGATPHAVTGGTNGNLFRIAAASGPATTADIDPLVAGVQTSIQTNLFSVAGKLVLDTVAPVIAEVTPVATPSSTKTPVYVFSSTEAGTIIYGGDCDSVKTTAVSGNNTITFKALADGAHSNCTIAVQDGAGNISTPAVAVTPFVVQAAPILATVTAVSTPTFLTGPSFTFSSDEAGTITYGGTCSSTTTAAVAGNNVITFNTLPDGTYGGCTVRVTDAAGNISAPLAVNPFTIDTTVVISNVAVTNVTKRSAVITWTTNNPSVGSAIGGRKLKRGVISKGVRGGVDNIEGTTHSVMIGGLKKKTKYYFQITGQKADGSHQVVSGIMVFKTTKR